jgi:hypothetical protein
VHVDRRGIGNVGVPLTDFGRPTVIGITCSGNSTALRTGTMIIASAGIGG